jgi:AHBA synthesis associated protein
MSATYFPSHGTCRAVIFDLDGVLIDSSQVMEEAFKYAWCQFFGPGTAPFAEYKKHMGKGFTAIMDAMELPREMAVPFRQRSVELADRIQTFPGVFALLDSLRAGGTYLGVSTGKEAARTHHILRQLELESYFHHIVCSDEVTHPKPHPESVLIHLSNAGVAASQALFVGDAVADIECATSAGVQSIAALWGMGVEAELRAAQPTYVVRDLGDLHNLLEHAVGSCCSIVTTSEVAIERDVS